MKFQVSLFYQRDVKVDVSFCDEMQSTGTLRHIQEDFFYLGFTYENFSILMK